MINAYIHRKVTAPPAAAARAHALTRAQALWGGRAFVLQAADECLAATRESARAGVGGCDVACGLVAALASSIEVRQTTEHVP